MGEWTFERLADAIHRLEERVTITETTISKLVTIPTELKIVRDEGRDCIASLQSLRSTLETRSNEERIERKSDRRWLTGTVLSSAGLVIAAVGLLADKF